MQVEKQILLKKIQELGGDLNKLFPQAPQAQLPQAQAEPQKKENKKKLVKKKSKLKKKKK